VNWKEANVSLAGQAPERGQKRHDSHRVAPKAKRVKPSAEQTDLRTGWNHVAKGCIFDKNTIPTPNPNPEMVTEAPKQPTLTTNKKTAKPKKPVPKITAAFKQATVKPKKKATRNVKTMEDNPKSTNVVVTTQPTTSALKAISDLIHYCCFILVFSTEFLCQTANYQHV
jgi:hypothetical protein